MPQDENTYGFSKSDAGELVQLIGGIDREYTEGRVRGNGGSGSGLTRVFLTPGGGIAARSGATLGSATCTHYTVTAGTRATASATETVYNDFTSAIGGSVDIIAARIDGIWVAIAEDCPSA